MRQNSWIAVALALIILVLGFSVLNERQGVLGGIVGQDEGSFVAIRPIWNFTGTGVTVTEDAANNRMDVDIGAASGAPANLSYITASAEAGLSAERVLTAGSGIALTDGGANTTMTAALGPLTADWDQTGAYDIVLNDVDSDLKILEGGGTPTLFGIFDVTDLTTADKTYTFPNATGTVITSGNLTDITTVGTIGTGTWQGTTIKQPYISIATSAGDANTLTLHDLATGTPTDNYILKWDAGGGNWTWEEDATGAGSGDISDVGDVSTGAAFTSGGTAGTSLWFYDADGRGQLTIADLAAARTYTFPDATGEISLLGQSIADAEVDNDISLTNITQITNRSHTSLTDIGSNTHAQIDTHIADGTLHFTQANITATGTIASGTWNGTVISPVYGGTGIANNAASTLTISGAYATTLTVSGATALTLPSSGTVTALGNTTTGSGSIVLATSPSLVTPALGAATATSINGLTVTSSAGTLTIANNASAALVTSGNYSITLTATGATNVTLPTSGTLSTLALVGAGSDGTEAANAGDNTTSARSDHEHYIYRDMVFFYNGTLETGDPGVWIRLDEAGASGDIISAYAVLGTAGSTSSTIDILKCSQANIDGTPSWATIFTNKLLIDANERSTNTASTPPSLSVTSWTANDHFRMNVDTAGTDAANATIKMKIRVKNKAS